jgi:ribose transport system substrate-binding protein
MNKKINGIAIAIACVFFTLAIICPSPLLAKDLNFVIMSKGVHPWWEPGAKGFEDAANKFGGIKVQYLSPPEFSIEAQTRMIENLIARGVDGMAIAVYDAEGIAPVLNEAAKRGIAVITWDNDSPGSKRTCFIGTNNKEAGALTGKTFAKLMNYKGKYVISTADLTGLNLLQRIEGIRSVTKQHSEMVEVREPLITGQMPEKGLENAENLLTAFPDIDGVVDPVLWGFVGVYKVLKERGRKPGEVKLVGWTDFPDVLQGIKEGYIAAALRQNPYAMGYLSLMALKNIKMGKKPKFDHFDTGIVLLNKDNLDTYSAVEMAAAKTMAETFDDLWE